MLGYDWQTSEDRDSICNSQSSNLNPEYDWPGLMLVDLSSRKHIHKIVQTYEPVTLNHEMFLTYKNNVRRSATFFNY